MLGNISPLSAAPNSLTLTLDEGVALPRKRDLDLMALDDAPNRLAAMDAARSRIVELRFFRGLSIDETAKVPGISPTTVKRRWSTARVGLYQELSAEART